MGACSHQKIEIESGNSFHRKADILNICYELAKELRVELCEV